MMELISIVIPIYNVERYLARCLDSLLAQTYSNLEIILVNDGATDGCADIIETYRVKDDRIVVINKENGGLSDARNKGTEVARGKFITYVDSDDYVAADYVEYLYSLIQKYDSDVAVCEYICTEEDSCFRKDSPVDDRVKVLNGREAVRYLLTDGYSTMVTAWGKLYRQEIAKQYPFPKGRKHEDEATTAKYYYAAERVAVGKRCKYAYFTNPAGIMAKAKKETAKNEDMIWALRSRADFFEEQGEVELCRWAWRSYYSALLRTSVRKDDCCRDELLEDRTGRHLHKQTKLMLLLYHFAYPLLKLAMRRTLR